MPEPVQSGSQQRMVSLPARWWDDASAEEVREWIKATQTWRRYATSALRPIALEIYNARLRELGAGRKSN